jgi:hypothetical protein
MNRRAEALAFYAAWASYERMNRRAADDYIERTTTPPLTACGRPSSRSCPRCGAKTRARTEHCAACVREESEQQ